MPGGAYEPGVDYPSFVLTDLLPAVEQRFRVSTARSDRAIGGISRGGYYALRIAFEHPDMFTAAGGHSPAVNGDLSTLARTASGLDRLQVTLDAVHFVWRLADTTVPTGAPTQRHTSSFTPAPLPRSQLHHRTTSAAEIALRFQPQKNKGHCSKHLPRRRAQKLTCNPRAARTRYSTPITD